MSEIAEVLGANIRSIRKARGWTQEKLAELAEISVPFMTQIELARKSPSLEVVESIAKALGVSYNRLFWVAEELPSDRRNVWEEFRNSLADAVQGAVSQQCAVYGPLLDAGGGSPLQT